MNVVISLLDYFKVTQSAVEDINKLLAELSQNAKDAKIEDIIAVACADYLFIATDNGRIVGMATLIAFQKPTGLVGQVEDVVVSSDYRGLGIGRDLMNTLIETAKARNLRSLQLTSNSCRVAAHGLYHSLGFVVKETTNFHLPL